MYKFRLMPVSVFALVCLIIPFASSKLLSATKTTIATPATPLLELSRPDFITAVNNNNIQVQNELDAALAKLLRATQPRPADTPAADTSQTSPAAETPPASNRLPTTNNTPTTSGFNPYSN